MESFNNRILIIDDNHAIHDDFHKILVVGTQTAELDASEAELFGAPARSAGYAVDSAYQGEEGYSKVLAAVEAGKPYAMAFVDMRMPPGWDGLQTIDQIWTADPDIQIVICTAYSDHAWEDILGHFGASDRLLILKKPFDPAEVGQFASTLTEKWRQAARTKMKFMQMNAWVAEKGAQLDQLMAKRQA